MPAPDPIPEALVRALTAEVAERLRRGEPRTSVRAVLVAAGLSGDLADGFLASVAPSSRWPVGSVIGTISSIVTMALLPAVGLASGCWLAWENWPTPPERACGMWVFIPLFFSSCQIVIGLSVGVVLAYVAVWGISAVCVARSDSEAG
jgi:hypothetical protein